VLVDPHQRLAQTPGDGLRRHQRQYKRPCSCSSMALRPSASGDKRSNGRQILQLCQRTGKLDTQFSRRFFGICATTTTTTMSEGSSDAGAAATQRRRRRRRRRRLVSGSRGFCVSVDKKAACRGKEARLSPVQSPGMPQFPIFSPLSR
jgi:hypothetical protein